MVIRFFFIALRRVAVAVVLSMFAAVVTLNAAKAAGFSSSFFDPSLVLYTKTGGTVAAAVVVFLASLRFVAPSLFYELFINDRFYVGQEGSVMRPATFKKWVDGGGDLVFDGEIYYNSILIRPATAAPSPPVLIKKNSITKPLSDEQSNQQVRANKSQGRRNLQR